MYKKNKHLYLLSLLLFYQGNLSPQGTWERFESPTNKFLRSVHFVDSLYGWAVGDSGIIIHSSDSGVNWAIQNSESENNIYDVFFLNRNLGWASSWRTSRIPFGTELLKTTNGGKNWINPSHPQEDIFGQCILFLDSLNGWMGGQPYPIVNTTDGGNTWKHAAIDSSLFSFFPVKDIKFYNSQFGYASGGILEYGGVIWSTSNGGDYWYAIDPQSAPPDPFWQIHIFDSLNVLGVGGDFETFGVGMIRTTDGGLHWNYEYIGMPGVATDLEFRTDNEAWSTLVFEQKLIYSFDSGFTWNQVPTPENTIISDLIFPDSLHGFAVGRDGAILKYKPSPVTNVISNKDIIQKNIDLYQNYPNPFNPITKIRYSIPEDEFIKLTVYDLLGKEIALLVNEQQGAGSYEFEFNAENLSSGIYIYILSTSSYRSLRKMIVIR